MLARSWLSAHRGRPPVELEFDEPLLDRPRLVGPLLGWTAIGRAVLAEPDGVADAVPALGAELAGEAVPGVGELTAVGVLVAALVLGWTAARWVPLCEHPASGMNSTIVNNIKGFRRMVTSYDWWWVLLLQTPDAGEMLHGYFLYRRTSPEA